jgi:hypothetical protein
VALPIYKNQNKNKKAGEQRGVHVHGGAAYQTFSNVSAKKYLRAYL